MTQDFENHMCKFIQEQSRVLKQYLLAASDSKDQCLYYLENRLGTTLPSVDIRNCELLVEARFFRGEVKLTQDGRNRYILFYLTDLGKEIVQNIKKESVSDEINESMPIAENTKK